MYYSRLCDPYSNIELISFCEAELPMHEFAQGNFFQGHKIAAVYSNYIKKCLLQLTKKNTCGEKNIDDYLIKKMANLRKEHSEWTAKKFEADKDIENTKNRLVTIKQTLKNAGEGDADRDAFYKFREKKDYDIALLQRAFDNLQEDNRSKYDETKELFEKFIALASAIDDAEFTKLLLNHHIGKKKKREATRKLSSKSSRPSIEKQIQDIETGRERTRIHHTIAQDLLKSFYKIDDMGYSTDSRDLQEMFVSILATHLIVGHKTDRALKHSLIRNHTDKIGLWDHIVRIYNDSNCILYRQAITGRGMGEQNRDQIMKNCVVSLGTDARKLLQRMPESAYYFWMYNNLEDDTVQQSMSASDWKNTVIDELVTHLETVLENPDKQGDGRDTSDDKLKKLFEGIYSITEGHEFEASCKELWHIDVNNYRQLLEWEGEILMKHIYTCMDTEERDVIETEYKGRAIYDKIKKEVLDREFHENQKQLSLYNFPAIYNIQGYVKFVHDHMRGLLKPYASHQKKKVEYTVWHMLQNQGYGQYIESGTPLTPLVDKDFLELLGKTPGGKSLCALLKQKEVLLLPDINKRIETMRQTTRGDLI